MANESFADKLNILIKDRENETGETLSNIKLGEEIGVSRQQIARYKNGDIDNPTPQTIKALCNFFNVSTDYFLTDTDCKNTDTDIKSVCAYTGLSEEAVIRLHTMRYKTNALDLYEGIEYDSDLFQFISDGICSFLPSLYTEKREIDNGYEENLEDALRVIEWCKSTEKLIHTKIDKYKKDTNPNKVFADVLEANKICINYQDMIRRNEVNLKGFERLLVEDTENWLFGHIDKTEAEEKKNEAKKYLKYIEDALFDITIDLNY